MLEDSVSYPESPTFTAVTINLRPHDSPPLHSSTDSPSSDEEEPTAGRRRRPAPALGDRVLLDSLAPNHPDIAQIAEEEALEPVWEEDSDSMSQDEHDLNGGSAELAQRALSTSVSYQNGFTPESPEDGTSGFDGSPSIIKSENGLSHQRHSPRPHRPQPPPINTTETKYNERNDDGSGIATSPNLQKYTITPLEPSAQTLPRLQNSPARQSSQQSPENLPSLREAVGELVPMPSQMPSQIPSPPLQRTHTFPPGTYSSTSNLSPGSSKTMSPPSAIPSHPSGPASWRTPQSDLGSATSETTPSTVSPTASSNNYLTPSDQDQKPRAEGDSQGMISGPLPGHGPYPPSVFKCTYPNCNAQPFQTQYLLNSHANVHSSNRPHYCPEKGCPRSYGGKGFKRKNEMIRHGLVHNSPGYVCPFCPDQQHKYPRPDNLQRHVRVHHVDKDKEDPALRDVLAQRPDGPNRGRRRRMGS